MLNIDQVRELLFPALGSRLEAAGFTPSRDPGCFIREFGSHQHVIKPDAARWGRQPCYVQYHCGVRHEAIQHLLHQPTGLPKATEPYVTTFHRFFFAQETQIAEPCDLAIALDQVSAQLRAEVFPCLDEWSDLSRARATLEGDWKIRQYAMGNLQAFILLAIYAIQGDAVTFRANLAPLRSRYFESCRSVQESALMDPFLNRLSAEFPTLRADIAHEIAKPPETRDPITRGLDDTIAPAGLVLADAGLDAVPADVAKLKTLRRIDLSHNRLVRLPEDLQEMDVLHTVDLTGNKGLDLENVFRVLAHLSNLLKLTHCNISSIPPEIGGMKRLMKLYLDYNQIFDLPDAIGDLESLIFLDLTMNPLRCLPRALGNLTNLEKLILNHTLLEDVPDEALGLPRVKRVELSGSKISRSVKARFRKRYPRAQVIT